LIEPFSVERSNPSQLKDRKLSYPENRTSGHALALGLPSAIPTRWNMMEHWSTLRTITTIVLGTIACNVALSQPQTGYYQVADLIDSNHVNVRAEPTADSKDLGDIASGSKPYEIIETDPSGDWGRILWLEATGWVALRFMEPIQVEQLAKTEVSLQQLNSSQITTLQSPY